MRFMSVLPGGDCLRRFISLSFVTRQFAVAARAAIQDVLQ